MVAELNRLSPIASIHHVINCASRIPAAAYAASVEPAQNQNKVGEGDNAYYLGEGLSKSFRQFLNELLKKYNFSHQIKEGSAFDQ